MNSLKDTVISNGFCIGCGICSAVSKNMYCIKLNKKGMYEAIKEDDNYDDEVVLNSCPFYSKITESNISKDLYGSLNNNSVLGYFSLLGAGYINKENDRVESSSGGMTTWVLKKLFENREIDGVIHVKNSFENETIFEYSISYSIDELVGGRKTRYYPIELSRVLEKIRCIDMRLAVVGVPCFIKALRLLQSNTSDFSSIKFFIGLICGQLKSSRYSELLKLQTTTIKGRLVNIDYRLKKGNDLSFNYNTKFTIKSKSQQLVDVFSKSTTSLFGTDWGMGMFKYKACDVCDDVFNETADIVLGDAWIEPYIYDWKGTNVVVVRNRTIYDIIKAGIISKEINFDEISIEKCIETQGANVRHRQNLVSFRLEQFAKVCTWVPIKRFFDEVGNTPKQEKIQKARLCISSSSHKIFAFTEKFHSIFLFKILMSPLLFYYKFLYRGFRVLIPSAVKQIIRNLR